MRKLCVFALSLSLLLAACSPTSDSSTENQASQIAALESRIAALEAQVATLSAEPPAAPDEHAEDAGIFEVTVAQYVMDTAGFHSMDEALNETKTVEASYLSAVKRVQKVLSATVWPEELQAQSTGLMELLDKFAEALDADNGEEAATLASEVHTAQHDLSGAIDEWLGVGGEHEHG
jgi:outer membrane murein-binding lipoprotein Lpp